MIEFYDKTSNRKVLRRGIQIGRYLAVSTTPDDNYYTIWRYKEGIHLDLVFDSRDTALWLANKIYDVFGEYFILWELFSRYDIFYMARYSVKNGRIYARMIQSLREEKIITKAIIEQAIFDAQQHFSS